MGTIRTKNRFGRRYIRLKELRDYTVDLGLCTHPPGKNLMEFFEREGLLTPVCRLCFPAEIIRRFASERSEGPNGVTFSKAVEPDGTRLDAAAELIEELHRWPYARVYGESEHVLDVLANTHRPFIQTKFSPTQFTPWEEFRVPLYEANGKTIFSNIEQDSPAFYHYWQIFWLAAILRSGVHMWFPLDDNELFSEILQGKITSCEKLRGRAHQSVNLEAFHELKALREHVEYFEAIGYYEAYTQNALQTLYFDRDEHGFIPPRPWRRYLRRKQKIARETFTRSGLSVDDLISFIGKQCEWWDNACRVGPIAVADEYKRNINASIGLVRAATDIDPQTIIQRVGRRTGHFKATLEIIFPDWTTEQRDLTIRSLKLWTDKHLAELPPPFPVSEAELNEFCDWLEGHGLYQYYWHFHRLVDLQDKNDQVHHAASTAEVVGFATLCEMIANEVMKHRDMVPRGHTLSPKLQKIFDNTGPVDLSDFFCKRKNKNQKQRFGHLTNTNKQSLQRRLAQIDRIKAGGPYNSIVRIMLSFMAIRNEGTHIGLIHLGRVSTVKMIQTLSLASLMMWKAR